MTIQTWTHSRKGRITGEIIGRSGEFLDIRLTRDVQHGREAFAGETITVREEFLTEAAG